MTTRRMLLWGLVMLAAQRAYSYWPELPGQIASHFGANGVADGWSSKGSFVGMMLGVCLLMAITAEGVALLIRVLPSTMINVPNPSFWLAPARRAETLSDLQKKSLEMMTFTLAFLVYGFEVTLVANLTSSPRLGGGFMLALIVYLGAIVALVARMLLRYSRTPDTGDEDNAAIEPV